MQFTRRLAVGASQRTCQALWLWLFSLPSVLLPWFYFSCRLLWQNELRPFNQAKSNKTMVAYSRKYISRIVACNDPKTSFELGTPVPMKSIKNKSYDLMLNYSQFTQQSSYKATSISLKSIYNTTIMNNTWNVRLFKTPKQLSYSVTSKEIMGRCGLEMKWWRLTHS